MRRVLVSLSTAVSLVVLAAGPSPALAQRPSTTTLTCAQARSLVARQGAAVLGTGGPTFDRFVRDR